MKYLLVLLLFTCSLLANPSTDLEFESKLDAFSESLKKNENLELVFYDLNSYWRTLVDHTTNQLLAIDLFAKNSKIQDEILSDGLEQSFNKLLKIGKIRNQYLQKTSVWSNFVSFKNFDLDFLLDMKRELQLVPMRILGKLLLKAKEIKALLGSGFSGIKSLVVQAMSFLMVFIVPFFAWLFLKRIKAIFKTKSEEFYKKRFHSSDNYKKFKLYRNLESYVMNVGLFLVFHFLKDTFEHSYLLLLILEYYFLYKIVRTGIFYFLGFVFDNLVSKADKNQAYDEKKKIFSSRIGQLFFLYMIFDQILDNLGGTGVTFLLIKSFIKIAFILIIFTLARAWSKEIISGLEKKKQEKVAGKLLPLMNGKKSLFFSLPSLVYLILSRITQYTLKKLEHFDFFKQLSAKLFKQKLISTDQFPEDETQTIPDEYKALFDPQVICEHDIKIKSSPLDDSLEVIEHWLKNSDEENSFAITGQSGGGKTTLLGAIEKHFSGKINIIKYEFTKRVTSESDLLKTLVSLFELEQSESILPLIKKDKEIEKTLVLLDSAHNIFLSRVGGFDAYKKFLEILNTRLENIFWVGSFNQNAWNFLRAGYRKSEGFRFVFPIRPFSDVEVKGLIEHRHKKSNYKVSFNRILKAMKNNYDSESMEEAKELFFRILWEQSAGNPQIAMYLWKSSLRLRHDIMEVGLPEGDSIENIQNLSDNTLFVYAALMRHENLSVKEAIQTTNLGEGAVRNAMKIGLETEILKRNKSGQYSFYTRFQYRILNILKQKNLIIGN